MKPSLLILLFALLLPMPANAKLYKWIDDAGVFHAVDDLHKVPQKDRAKLGLDLEALREEIRAPEKSIIKPAPQTLLSPTKAFEQRRSTDPSAEMFGGKTLEWWAKTLSRVKNEKGELQKAINSKEEYISVYLYGLRLDQKNQNTGDRTYYTQKSVDRYNRYVKALPEDKEKLAKKIDYLDKLLRRAKNAGVPRNVR